MKKLLILVMLFSMGLAGVASAEMGKFIYHRWDNGDTNTTIQQYQRDFSQAPTSTNTAYGSPTTVGLETPTWENGGNYAARFDGWLVPPADGIYRFWISSDDYSEFWLSTDDQAANAVRMCQVNGWTGQRNWNDGNGGGEAVQRSAYINLRANKAYRFYTLWKEGGGGDGVSVAWGCPQAGIANTTVIALQYLSNTNPNDTSAAVALPSGLETGGPVEYDLWDVADITTLGIIGGIMNDFSTYPPPTSTGTIDIFGVGPMAGQEDFAFRQYAVLKVDADTVLEFGINSDDGSKLYIGDWWTPGATMTKICDYDGWHGADGFRYGAVPVKAGYLGVMAEMYEDGGGEALYVNYGSDTIGWQAIPATAMVSRVRSFNPTPHKVQNVSTDAVLSWSMPYTKPTAKSVVYLAEAGQAFGAPIFNDVGTTVDPTLAAGKAYQWRVDVSEPNTSGGPNPTITKGRLWGFTTLPAEMFVTANLPQYLRPAAGSDVSLNFGVSGTGLSYQWKKDGSDIGTGNPLVIPAIAKANNGVYSCVVTQGAKSITSDACEVEVAEQVAYWPLESDFVDQMGNIAAGTYFSTDSSAPKFEAGIKGNALAINIAAANGEYVGFGAVGITANEPRTIACWAKNGVPAADITDWCTIFGFTSATSGDAKSFDIDKSWTDQYLIHRYGGEWGMRQLDGNWHFLVATYSGNTVTWFVDGYQGGTATSALWVDDIVQLGKRAHSDPVWRGWVDEARVFNYALGPTEVLKLYLDAAGGTGCLGNYPAYDFDQNCVVDTGDLVLFASEWLQEWMVP